MKVAAVVVAYNRRELLADTLDGLLAQTMHVDHIVVVDNASTDGSSDLVREKVPNAELITLTKNTGGAGGFAVGIAAALASHPDWVWVMDDDTVPTPSALQAAAETARKYADDRLVVMGSRVVWTDGDDHPMNTPKQKIGASKSEQITAGDAHGMAIRSISFVSAFLKADRISECGLPIADYFLWNDDFEYSARLARGQRAVYVPASVVEHRTKVKGSSDVDPGERFYFEVRNKLWVFLRSQALNPGEKFLYFAASIRRWIRTVRASRDRDTLWGCFRRGWRDGWRTSPRPNAVALEGTGMPHAAFQRVASLDGAAK